MPLHWEVVVTAKDTPEAIWTFIEHYKEVGASKVRIFYDDPNFAYPFDDPFVDVKICTGDYWRGMYGKRPSAIERRQRYNAKVALAESSADWLLNCDIDEQIQSDSSVVDSLSSAPVGANYVFARSIEPIYTSVPMNEEDVVSARYFKTTDKRWKFRKQFWNDVYQELGELSHAGFWGHVLGKSFVRVDARSVIDVPALHYPGDKSRSMGEDAWVCETLSLRHYDCRVFDSWKQKHIDRAEGRVRAMQLGGKRTHLAKLVQKTYEEEGDPGLLKLYERMYCMTPSELQFALDRGFVRDIGIY